jgi:hypothetical protein
MILKKTIMNIEKDLENLELLKKQLREIRNHLEKLQMRTNIINNFI